jgi:hypothetical protein
MAQENDTIAKRTQQILDEMRLSTIEVKANGLIPNSVQFPNLLLDQVMGLLEPSEWVVISYIARRTFGFKRERDKISRDQLCNGLVVDGEHKDWGTGLSISTVNKAIEFLKKIGLVIEQRTKYESYFSLQLDHNKIDWEELARRRAEKEARNKRKMARARSQNPRVPVEQKPGETPCATETRPPVQQNAAPLSDRDSLETKYLETKRGAADAAPPSRRDESQEAPARTEQELVEEIAGILPSAETQMAVLFAGRDQAVADPNQPEKVWLSLARRYAELRGSRVPDKELKKHARALRSVARRYEATSEVVRQAIERMAADREGEGWAFYNLPGPHVSRAMDSIGDVIGKIQSGTDEPGYRPQIVI